MRLENKVFLARKGKIQRHSDEKLIHWHLSKKSHFYSKAKKKRELLVGYVHFCLKVIETENINRYTSKGLVWSGEGKLTVFRVSAAPWACLGTRVCFLLFWWTANPGLFRNLDFSCQCFSLKNKQHFFFILYRTPSLCFKNQKDGRLSDW